MGEMSVTTLFRGKYISMIENSKYTNIWKHRKFLRILIRHTIIHKHDISRELLWYSFLELVTSVLPLINVPFIKTWIQNKYNFYIANKDENEKFVIRNMTGERKENLNKISNEVLKKCKICKQSPIILPSTGGCGHYYCYYCISGNLEASSEKSFICPECNSPLTKENVCFQTSINVRWKCRSTDSWQIFQFIPKYNYWIVHQIIRREIFKKNLNSSHKRICQVIEISFKLCMKIIVRRYFLITCCV